MKISGRYKSIAIFVVALIIIIFLNGNHSAASASLTTKLDILSESRLDQIIYSPAEEISLVLDDGSAEDAIGVGGTSSFIFFNRFTPDPSRFPFELTSYQVYFQSAPGVTVGDELNLFVYEDADSNPANGATLLLNYPITIKALDSWNEYVPVSADPLVIEGPGDLLIGLEALETPGTSYYPASIDTNNSQQRSWVGYSFLDPQAFSIIDDLGFPGNWMIRAYGTTTGTSGYLFYLPIISKPLPPPVLSPISNPNGESNFTVSWTSVNLATSYVLEEDDNGAFSSPVIIYDGASTSWSASNRAVGTYYYRVKARNSSADSTWSNVQSTTVVPPRSNVYIENDTGCTLCFEVFDTGIGQKCFSTAGSIFYGSFTVGNYRWAASACCGSMSDSDYFGSTWSYSFYCTSSVAAQAGSSALQCTPLSNGLTQSDGPRLP
jgi:hypothetical protein